MGWGDNLINGTDEEKYVMIEVPEWMYIRVWFGYAMLGEMLTTGQDIKPRK